MTKNLERTRYAKQLRVQGRTYREIAETMGVSRVRAQQIVAEAEKLVANENGWTNGLPSRVVDLFKRLEIEDHNTAQTAFYSGAIARAIKEERGMGNATLQTIALWLGLPGYDKDSKKKQAIEQAIALLQSHGYMVTKVVNVAGE